MHDIVDSSHYCEVMNAIMVLGIYEGLVDESIALEGSWVSHISGGCTLLELRGQSNIIDSPAEYEISIFIFMKMIHIGLVTGQGLSLPWASVKDLCLQRLPYFYAHTQLIYQSACLCMEWRTALLTYKKDQDVTQLSAIIFQALALDKQLEDWAKSVPSSAKYAVELMLTDTQLEWLNPLLNTRWRPLNLHSYSSLSNQILWRFYWMARAILNQALLFTNSLFKQRKVTPSPILCPADTESKLILFTDSLCESCLSTFISIVKQDPQYYSAKAIPNVLGYIILQVLPTIGLCLEQVDIIGIDLSTRREWVVRMRHFLRVNLGIAKGATAIPPSLNSNIPIQIWGFS
ncbi:C6 finger domain-containing protein [Fusarium coicis]|nr:C6 finger domain-containing protein [Fusarium coicis]